MCELYFLRRMQGVASGYDINQLLSMVEAGSSLNSDGFGLTNGCAVYKKPVKFEKCMTGDIISRFQGSSFIVGHTRYATSGNVKKDNSHPFYNKRFIWVHNGIISNYKVIAEAYKLVDIRVDSQVIGDLLYLKCGDDKDQDVQGILCDMMGELTGSFSVFIYDCVAERLYYFKSGCSFYFQLIHVTRKDGDYDVVVGCTDFDSIELMYDTSVGKKYGFSLCNGSRDGYINPVNDVLYEFTDSGLLELDKFTTKPVAIVNYMDNYSGYGNGGWYNNDIRQHSFSEDVVERKAWNLHDIEQFLSSYFDDDIKVFKCKIGKRKMYKVESSNIGVLDDILCLTDIDLRSSVSWEDLSEAASLLFYYDGVEDSSVKDYNDEYRVD